MLYIYLLLLCIREKEGWVKGGREREWRRGREREEGSEEGHVHVTVFVWRSEYNFQKSVLSFHCGFWRSILGHQA